MKKILVTGANGWLGGEVVKTLLARGDAVVATDIATGPTLQALQLLHKERLVFNTADLCEWSEMLRVVSQHRPDAVVHAAAIVGVIQCANIPLKANRVNVEGSINLFEAMRLSGVKRVVHVSTEETYGDFMSPVIDEEHPQKPVSIYGTTKLAVEHFGRMYSRDYGLQCANVRRCWVYGPHLPRLRAPRTFVEAALRGEALHVGNGAELAVDQASIADTVGGILLSLDKEEHRNETYNVATGVAPTIADVAEAVNRAIPGARITVSSKERYKRAGVLLSARKGALDITRARSELGYEPKYKLHRGIEATIEATRATLGVA